MKKNKTLASILLFASINTSAVENVFNIDLEGVLKDENSFNKIDSSNLSVEIRHMGIYEVKSPNTELNTLGFQASKITAFTTPKSNSILMVEGEATTRTDECQSYVRTFETYLSRYHTSFVKQSSLSDDQITGNINAEHNYQFETKKGLVVTYGCSINERDPENSVFVFNFQNTNRWNLFDSEKDYIVTNK